MKRNEFITMLAALVLAIGCVSAKEAGIPIRETRAYNITRQVVYLGGIAALRLDPKYRVAMVQAASALDTMVASKNWNLTTAATAIESAGVTNFRTEDAQLIIVASAGLTSLIDLIAKKPIDLRNNRTAEAWITAAADGLNLALGKPTVDMPAGRSLPGEVDQGIAFLLRERAVATRGKP